MTKAVTSSLLSLIFFAFIGCGPGSESGKELLPSGIALEHMDTTINPGDDFHAFVNGTWLANTEIPADKSNYGNGIILHEQSEDNVKKIIEESAAGDFEEGTNEQMVGDLYNSFLNMENRNALGAKPLEEEFASIDQISDYVDLARHFAKGIKYYDVPFSYSVFPDLVDPTKYSLYYFQSGLGLPDKEYYFRDDERSVQTRQAYLDHMIKMMELAGLGNAETAANNIMALETKMASVNMAKELRRDARNIYNNIPTDSLDAIMPQFAWDVFLDESGVGEIEYVILGMLDYSKALDGIIHSTDLDIWKQYLKWNVINASASYLSEEIDIQNFEFYSKTLYGRQEQRPMWRRAVSVVNQHLGEVVGKVYVERHFPPAAKEKMLDMVDNLKKAYQVRISELGWMSDTTKTQALDKLSKFRAKIGYPDIWKDYTGLVIKEDDPLGNKVRSNLMSYDRAIGKLGGPIQKHEWAMTPQTVNAYYSPTMNEIVFPAAILQSPIFDLNVDDAVNYGAIGAIIGHEIGHGFDDSGSRYNGDGQLKNWWTDEDRSKFEELTSVLIEQYNSYEVLEDLFVNGQFTLGENIGDLGGLHIALEAYKMSLNGDEGRVIDGFTPIQRVFVGYAQSWRYKTRDEAMRVRINSDPHSPPRFRVNGVVRNIPEFYEAFNVSESDDLYLAPESRVKIW